MILTRGKQRNNGQMFAYWRVLYWTLVAFKLINSLLYHWQIFCQRLSFVDLHIESKFFCQ